MVTITSILCFIPGKLLVPNLRSAKTCPGICVVRVLQYGSVWASTVTLMNAVIHYEIVEWLNNVDSALNSVQLQVNLPINSIFSYPSWFYIFNGYAADCLPERIRFAIRLLKNLQESRIY